MEKKIIKFIILILIVIILIVHIKRLINYLKFTTYPNYLNNNLNMNFLNNKLPNFSLNNKNTNKIPKIIHITYYDKTKIPTYIIKQYQIYAKNYELRIYDDADIRILLKKYLGNKGVKIFNSIKGGAHKADFFRYVILYFVGGYYFDIKVLLIKPLKDIFTDTTKSYSSLSLAPDTIYNAILATHKNNNIMGIMISFFFDKSVIIMLPFFYLLITRLHYLSIIKYSTKTDKLHTGKNNQWILFTENDDCTKSKKYFVKKDRYDRCVMIKDKDNNNIMIGRDPQYPY